MLLSTSKKCGFSLIESVVVVAITCLVILLPQYEVNHLKNQVQREQIINRFKSEFNCATKYAVLRHQSISIKYLATANQIRFSDYRSDYLKYLELPSNMNIQGLNTIKISPTGIAAPKTIIFKSQGWQKEIKIQMMWGQLIEK